MARESLIWSRVKFCLWLDEREGRLVESSYAHASETKGSDDWKLWPIEPCADPFVWFRQFFYVSQYSNCEEVWRWGLAHSRVLRLWHDLVSSLIPSRQVQNIYFLGFCTASWIPTIVAQAISLFGHNFSTSAMLWSFSQEIVLIFLLYIAKEMIARPMVQYLALC